MDSTENIFDLDNLDDIPVEIRKEMRITRDIFEQNLDDLLESEDRYFKLD